MQFQFSTKNGHPICTIEAHDKIQAKGIYKKMHQNQEVNVPPAQANVTKANQ